jgi:hypothetical protein
MNITEIPFRTGSRFYCDISSYKIFRSGTSFRPDTEKDAKIIVTCSCKEEDVFLTFDF